jgi:hypothetical protein
MQCFPFRKQTRTHLARAGLPAVAQQRGVPRLHGVFEHQRGECARPGLVMLDGGHARAAGVGHGLERDGARLPQGARNLATEMREGGHHERIARAHFAPAVGIAQAYGALLGLHAHRKRKAQARETDVGAADEWHG